MNKEQKDLLKIFGIMIYIWAMMSCLAMAVLNNDNRFALGGVVMFFTPFVITFFSLGKKPKER